MLITTGGTADAMEVDGLNGQAIASAALQLNQLYVQDGASFTGDVTLNDGGNITLDTSSSFGGDTLSLLGSGTIYESQGPGGLTGTGSVADTITFAAGGGLLTLAADPTATLDVSGDIDGTGSVLVNGGTVQLDGATNYTGNTQVQDGTLVITQFATALAKPVFVTDGVLSFGIPGVQNSIGNSPIILAPDTVVAAGGSDTIEAGGASLLVYGSSDSLTFLGGSAASTVVGGSGSLNITGGSAGAQVFGGAGAVSFTGGTANDTVVASAGALSATGGAGADLIFGGTSGQDSLYTGAGNTTIVGAAGAALFANGAGNVAVVAAGISTIDATSATGTDTLFAVGSSDTIIGAAAGLAYDVLGTGNVTIFTGAGNSDIFGDGGSLQLNLTEGYGGGTINVAGVSLAQLNVTLSNYNPGEAAQDLASATVAGGNTYIALSDDTHLNLFGITGLTSANFS